MQNLLELISVINRNKTKSIEFIGSLPSKQSMVKRFYDKITNGEISTDEEAAEYFMNLLRMPVITRPSKNV